MVESTLDHAPSVREQYDPMGSHFIRRVTKYRLRVVSGPNRTDHRTV